MRFVQQIFRNMFTFLCTYAIKDMFLCSVTGDKNGYEFRRETDGKSSRMRVDRIQVDWTARAPTLGSLDFDGFFRVWCLKISSRTEEFNGLDQLDRPYP